MRVRKGCQYQSWRWAREQFLACLQPLWSPYLRMGANTVRHCSDSTHKSRAPRGCLFSQEGVREKRAAQRLNLLPSWPQLNTGLKSWRDGLEQTQDPHGCLGSCKLGVSWELSGLSPLGLGDATTSFSELGVTTPCCRQRELALGGRTYSSEGCSRVGAGARTRTVSVGNGGFQLLQAAATELCSIRFPILRQLLCAH